MSSISDYKSRVSGTIKSNITNSTKQLLKINFKTNPSYKFVTGYKASNPSVAIPLDSWIVDYSNTKDLKQIQLIPDQVLDYGDLIYWKNEYWLVTTVDDMGDIYYRGSISKCLSSLKWRDFLGATKEAYFTLTKDSQSGLGIVEGKVMIEPTEVRYLAIQKNIDTEKIKKLQRFIFDGDRVWKVTSVSDLKSGIMELTLEEAGDLNSEKDNLALRIADYYTNTVISEPIGQLFISSSSTPVNQIKVTQTKVFQAYIGSVLTPVTWELIDPNNLVVMTDFTSTNCTLKANSLSRFGTIQLKATLQSDTSQFYLLDIKVKSIS